MTVQATQVELAVLLLRYGFAVEIEATIYSVFFNKKLLEIHQKKQIWLPGRVIEIVAARRGSLAKPQRLSPGQHRAQIVMCHDDQTEGTRDFRYRGAL